MSVDRLPSGRFRARLTINGAKHAATFATRQEAEQWEILTHAQVDHRVTACSRDGR